MTPSTPKTCLAIDAPFAPLNERRQARVFFSPEEAHRASGARAGISFPSALPSSDAGLLPPGTTQRSPCLVSELSDRRRVMHRPCAVWALRYAQASEAHTKKTQNGKRSPSSRYSYNDSLTGSNACATVPVRSGAFSCSLSFTPAHRFSQRGAPEYPPFIHCLALSTPGAAGDWA